jgi:hypothetical protein
MGLFMVFSLIIGLRFSEAKELKPVKLRITSWNQSLRILQDHPFTGVGMGNFGPRLPKYIKPHEATSKYVHNFYLQLLTETGIFFFVFVLFVLFGFLRKIDFKNPDPEKSVYFSILISILIYNIIDIGLYFFSAGLIFVLALSQIPFKTSSNKQIPLIITIIPLILFSAFLFINFRSESLQQEGQLYLDSKKSEQAIPIYTKSLAYFPRNFQALYEVAISYYRMKNFSQAEYFIDKTLRINPLLPSANYLKSILLLKKNEITSALVFASKANKLYPIKEKYKVYYEQLKKNIEDRISRLKN